jgi:phosphoglycerate dehydrogenase-like enzyme
MPKVLVTEPVAPALMPTVQRLLPPDVRLEAVPTLSDDDFARHAADAEVLLVIHRRIDTRLLAMAPRVRFIQRSGIGYDNIVVADVRAAGIPAAYTPGANADTVAEHAIMLMLVLLKRFVQEEKSTRDGQWQPLEFAAMGMGDITGGTVGLVGLGHVGRAVAARLGAFGAKILYTAHHHVDASLEQRLQAAYVPLPELLAASNIVSLHVPLTDETRHLIGDEQLALMPKGSYLINVSRGAIIDEGALRRAIESGHLAGAGLDVIEHEVAGGNSFADLPQVIVTPHTAGVSRRGMESISRKACANIVRFLAGEPPVDLIPGTRPGDR